MLVAIDVGNTQTVIGLFDGRELVDHWRIGTVAERTSDELALMFQQFLGFHGHSLDAEVSGLSVSAVQARVRRLEADGVIRGYTALLDAEAIGLPLAALIAITPLDPAQPDDAPERLAGLPAIEACHSVAGDDSYVLFVRVATPTALEQLIREIRRRANVSTRTTVVLQTFFDRRTSPDRTPPSVG